MVLFDQATYDKLLSEAPKYKLITPSILSDRLRVMFEILSFYCVYVFLLGIWHVAIMSCLSCSGVVSCS